MKGLKKHSHEDRQRVIEEMIPLIQKKFGENLIALAATSSYARNEDFDYSDLELTAFVKEMPDVKKKDGIGKIRDGLLVELVWMTKDTYLETTREVTPEWYLAGSDTLQPLINESFINELNTYQVADLRQKCLTQAAKHWHETQEATAKVLNAISAANREGIPLLLSDMLRYMLIVLSFLNQTPFITFSKFISQAKTFEIKPESFASLIDIAVQGAYQDLPTLEKTTAAVFREFEAIFEGLGIELYDNNIDPN